VTISSEIICPIVSPPGKAQSNQVNTFLEQRLAILLTRPGWVSDSWTTIFLRSIHAAITTGNATYPHLQKTTSTRWRSNWYNDWKHQIKKRNMSEIFLSLDFR